MDNWNGPYLANFKALIDPWGTPYQYRSPAGRVPFAIASMGADKTEGGAGDASDINSENIIAQ